MASKHNLSPENSDNWERETLIQLATASLKEQRRARRWSIFFKVLTFAYLAILLFLLSDFDYEGTKLKGKHTALVELKGIIAAGEEASADNIVDGLRDAFEDKNTAGVILKINSPGGSPVQSGIINDEIKRLREEFPDIPFYSVVSDMAASGAYYVAVAADKIFADKASIIGSIGVRMDSFGFVEAINKLGVSRRLMTAGEHKGLLDPFLPINALEKVHLESTLNTIHQQFINTVKDGRGTRLAEDESLFSGLIWAGQESVKLGLVDELGNVAYVAREIIGEEDVVEYTKERDLFERLATRVGTSLSSALETTMGTPRLR